VKYGGNTTCFEIWASEQRLVVDAGTGIIQLGRDIVNTRQDQDSEINCFLLLTHLHHDHIQGLPFFAPFIHPQGRLRIFGFTPGGGTTLQQELLHLIQPPVSPLGVDKVLSQYQIDELSDGDLIQINPGEEFSRNCRVISGEPQKDVRLIQIQVHHGQNHPQNGVLIYRIWYRNRSLVIATDTEGIAGGDRDIIRFAQGADLLIHDAEYDENEYGKNNIYRQGWGHSTWKMAVEVAQNAGVGRLVLFHHNAAHSDDTLDAIWEKANKELPGVIMAKESLELSVAG